MIFLSFLLGLIAWIVPLAGMLYSRNNIPILSTISFGACTLSLTFPFYNIKYWVSRNDWSALMDVVPTLVSVVTILVIVTIVLNIALLLKYFLRNKTRQ